VIASKVPNVTMFTGIALRVHEFRLSELVRRRNQPIPNQGGSQPPPEHSESLFLPTLHDCRDCYTSALEEPSLELRGGSRLNTGLHKVKGECSNPPSNSSNGACEK